MDIDVEKLVLGEPEKKPKKKYKILQIEPDVADSFRKAAKALDITQTELLRYMIAKLHAEAVAEAEKRGI